mmetsp:Transcript_33838/g.99739  ORF Transcript_33838/g.99739 Transcript_33838/m.99739 type:complete len:117 (+) Transcript_33838:1255-1605(+)
MHCYMYIYFSLSLARSRPSKGSLSQLDLLYRSSSSAVFFYLSAKGEKITKSIRSKECVILEFVPRAFFRPLFVRCGWQQVAGCGPKSGQRSRKKSRSRLRHYNFSMMSVGPLSKHN